ncbi:prolactin-releasing peptide receptor-like [Lineus longissimus]|uniref:prolactin-releasing peptide receptor-like n=1 Tax=Lineus longissimus TaxID=88925 RepID=UPI00315D2769
MADPGIEADPSQIDMIARWLDGNMLNGSLNVQHKIRKPLQYVYPLFIFLHALTVIGGVTGNIGILVIVIRKKLYNDPLYFFMANLAISDIIKSVFVLPLTLTNLMMTNWVFGSFICFFLPMLQSFPVYVTMLTFLMIAIDRYRTIVYPMKSRVPAGLCTIGVWVLSVCIVLPHAVYLKYIDLGTLGADLMNEGICYVSFGKHYEEYVRAMFVVMYALPLAVCAFLYIKSSAEIKARETASPPVLPQPYRPSIRDESSRTMSEGSYHSRVTWSMCDQERRIEPEGASGESSQINSSYMERSYHDSDDEIDVIKEKRTQKYMISMVTIFGMCWCPLNIIYLVTPFLVPEETETKEKLMDIFFITFSWFGFLSTCSNPVLFASWRMSETAKDRLRGYFRFSNRRRDSAHSQVSRCTEICGGHGGLCSSKEKSDEVTRAYV